MPARVSLQFSTGSQENAERFIDEYVLDALDRVPEMDGCDSFTIVPGHPTTGDRTAGLQVSPPDHPIYLTIRGETDDIIDAERDRWNSLVEQGVVTDWEMMKATDREEMVEELGIVPAAVETYPDEATEYAPFGWWMVLHTVTVQLNYSLAEELAA